MKKLIAIVLLAAVSTIALAGGSSQSASNVESQSSVDFSTYPRTLTFGTERNAITVDGQIQVCKQPAVTDWNKGTCKIGETNAWSLAEEALPGWVLKRYEYRMVGSGGYRHLILYFSKK